MYGSEEVFDLVWAVNEHHHAVSKRSHINKFYGNAIIKSNLYSVRDADSGNLMIRYMTLSSAKYFSLSEEQYPTAFGHEHE
jgi:hypothetical protein